MSDDLARRVRRLEDLLAIQQLFVDYGNHLDAGDFEAYANLFADDGEVMLGPLGRAKGRDEIRALMEGMLSGARGTSFHVITNPMVDLDGDRAMSTVMWTVIQRDADGSPKLSMLGHHTDVLVRDGGSWRFQQRKGSIDLPSRFPATGAGADSDTR